MKKIMKMFTVQLEEKDYDSFMDLAVGIGLDGAKLARMAILNELKHKKITKKFK